MLLNSRKQAAIFSGAGLMVMALAAMVAYGFIYSTFYVPGDGPATVRHLEEGLLLFNLGLGLWGLIVVLDILVAFGFYYYLRPYDKKVAFMVLITRLIYTAFLMVAVSRLVLVATGISSAQVMARFMAFEKIWEAGLILFGVHLMLTGYVALLDNPVPRIWGLLLIIAGVGYTGTSLLAVLSVTGPLVNLLEMVLILPMTIGELGFGLWLLLKGWKVEAYEDGVLL